MKKTFSLKFRFALAMSVAALALVVGLGALSVHFTEADLLRTLSDQQLGLVARAATDLDAKLQLATESLDSTAAAMPLDVVTSEAAFAAFFTQHPSLLRLFDELVIVNAHGVVVATFPDGRGRVGIDVSDRQYFRDALATKKPLVSDPIRHRASGLPIVNVVAPILDEDHRVAAVMMGVLSLTKRNVLGDLSAARLGSSGYFTVTTRAPGAVYLAHPDPARIMQPVPVEASAGMRLVSVAEAPGTRVSTVDDDNQALISYHPVANRRWVVAAVLPSAEAFAMVHRTRERAIQTGVAVALVVLPLVWLFAYWLLRPIERLRREVDRIGSDAGGTALATVSGDDEVSRVASAFNTMVAAQRASEALRIASDQDRRRLVAILESSHDFVAMTDPRGALTYLNASGRVNGGLALDADIGRITLNELFPAWAAHKVMTEAVPAALRTGLWMGQTAVLSGDGREIPVDHTLIAHRNIDGRLEFFSSLLHDTTAATSAAAAMRASEARMRSIADALTVLVAFIDLDYRFRFVNSRYEEHFGVDRSELIGKSILECIGPTAYASYVPYLERAATGETQLFERLSEAGLRSAHFRVKLIPQHDEAGAVIGFHFIHQDISDHKAEERRLSLLVRADALTGLLNRAGFEVAIDEAMARCRHHHSPMALFYLDVDRFKSINDRHGHPVGDALLRAFAERLVRAVRSADIVARLGGDEFVVIAEGLRSVDDVRAIARKVLRAIRPEFQLAATRLSITTTVGVATYSGDAMKAEQLIHRADAALYRAKNSGRDRWDLDDPAETTMPASIESGEALELTNIL